MLVLTSIAAIRGPSASVVRPGGEGAHVRKDVVDGRLGVRGGSGG